VAITKYLRRVGFGSGGSLTPEEAGFYPSANQDSGFNEGRRARLVFSRTAPAGVFEDAAQIDFEFVNTTGGVLDNTWVDADFTTLETAIDAWWASVRPDVVAGHVLDQIRWYKFGPSLPVGVSGSELPGPPVRIVDRNVAGSSAWLTCVYQMAISVTFKTAIRRRWGRVYVPGYNSMAIDETGRFKAVDGAQLADATDTLVADAALADFRTVVYSPTRRIAYAVESLQVDDVPDVIRSRRPRQTARRDQRST
jgi:hypothetical protein